MKNDESFRILVVDDNKELREILEEYLGGEGHYAEGAANGREALERHLKDPYDLIVTDLNMPEISGMELIKTIRKDNQETEFIIITGYASMDSAVEAVRIGAFDYIVKPFRMEELQVVVKNVRDKVMLKKLNAKLVQTLQSFYDEMERYRRGKMPEESESRDEPVNGRQASDTEQIVAEIRDMEKLRKGRLLIE
ncbi:MAG: response regulator [Syntrophorhabdaceae bacterium]|nr:response regulator [Syntrophorhabdaceae bacterium]